MATQNDQSPYLAVIADLEAKRDELNRTIENLRQMAGISASVVKQETERQQTEDQAPIIDGDNPFLGMKVYDAAKVILANKRKPMSPSDLVDAMEAGGLLLTGNKTNSVGSILNRRQKQVGDIVSPQRGMWGLKEWYPGRSFAKKQDEKNESTETSAPEQHASPTLIFPQASSD
ncbi:winged helix-turn-helix domain-containing protein [Marivita sp. S6314]|uniref:winged helix-turn-helix domain-containing protein n=1 Tax=Marivita sp. S6314 TaxID=2926406 RepID=UPI001FF53929|nr:winged helix-turn-helix domain-containing protein [Marivita sp. S6314]MCK0148553.1 winged helix-turn-helix domain-containing protein [Marivita sp. S6314]